MPASLEEQQKFVAGLQSFDKVSRDKFNQSFNKLLPVQKQSMLTAMEVKKKLKEEIFQFYGTVKNYTLQCFISSKSYMTKIEHYKMVPGPDFKGCVKV